MPDALAHMHKPSKTMRRFAAPGVIPPLAVIGLCWVGSATARSSGRGDGAVKGGATAWRASGGR